MRYASLAALALTSIVLASCGPSRWARPGSTDLELRNDLLDCSVSTAALGQASGGELEGCMRARGWLPENETAPLSEQPILLPDGRTLTWRGFFCHLPEGYAPAGPCPGTAGPTTAVCFFDGPGGVRIEIVFQESSSGFTHCPFPAPAGSFLYDRSTGQTNGTEWTMFVDRDRTGWHLGLGVFLLFDRRGGREGRAMLVIAAPLPAPESQPSPGLRLSPGQYMASEAFLTAWTSWLAGLCSP